VTVERNLSYSQYKETLLEILQPKEASSEKRPGVIVIHGGGWVGGTKEGHSESTCLRYVEKGFVCANVEYRLAKAAPDLGLVLGIESALGVARARDLLTTGVSAAFFGSEDFLADMGGRRSPSGLEVLYARSEVVLAGRLAGVPMIDQAVVAVEDDAAFTADAETGRALGFVGKICVQPRQVALAHAVFTPSEDEVAAARKVLAAEASGVAVVDGLMVDAVHIRMAHQVLEGFEKGDR